MEIRFLFSKTYDFLFALDDISVARINKSLGLLEKYGNTVSYPHTKYITGGIFELRVLGKKQIRILFMFKDGGALILHAFVKKTQKTPRKEIEYVMALKNRLR